MIFIIGSFEDAIVRIYFANLAKTLDQSDVNIDSAKIG